MEVRRNASDYENGMLKMQVYIIGTKNRHLNVYYDETRQNF